MQHPLVAGCHQAQLYTCSRFLDESVGKVPSWQQRQRLEGPAGRRRLGCRSAGEGKLGQGTLEKKRFSSTEKATFLARGRKSREPVLRARLLMP